MPFCFSETSRNPEEDAHTRKEPEGTSETLWAFPKVQIFFVVVVVDLHAHD